MGDAPEGNDVEARNVAGPVSYRGKQAEYAKDYGVSARNIKRWVKCGRDKNDPCPLDSPHEMAAWWERVMTWRVPDSLLALQAGGQDGEEGLVQPNLPEQPEAPSRSRTVDEDDLGMAQALSRLRRAEANASADYFEELEKKKPDDGQLERLNRRWQKIGEQLRKYEKDVAAHEKATGGMQSAADIKRELYTIHATIAAGVRGLLRNLRPRLKGKLDFEQDEIWEEGVNRLFQAWGESGFMDSGVFSE